MQALKLTAIAAILAGCPQIAAAQSGAGPEIKIFVGAGGSDPREEYLRSAGLVGDPMALITLADVPEKLREAARREKVWPNYQAILAQIGIDIPVGADGTTGECRPAYGSVEYAPALCAIIMSRGRFQHALTLDGKPKAATATITIQFSVSGPGGGGGLPPPPMDPSTWPVRRHNFKIAITGAPDWRRFSKVRDGRAAAVMVNFMAGAVTGCRTILTSGDDALDRATCKAAQTAQYGLDPAETYQSLPLIVHWQRGGARVQLPTRDKWQQTAPAGGSALTVQGFPGAPPATARLRISETGTVTDCRILQSAGGDAADIGFCAAMRRTVFSPAVDVFDRPIPTFYLAEVRFE